MRGFSADPAATSSMLFNEAAKIAGETFFVSGRQAADAVMAELKEEIAILKVLDRTKCGISAK